MSSRNEILKNVLANQPKTLPLPEVQLPGHATQFDKAAKFAEVLTNIGGRVIRLSPGESLQEAVLAVFGNEVKITSVSRACDFQGLPEEAFEHPNLLQDVEVALIDAQFGVAENGAVWLTEAQYKIRVLPFICQHLAVVLHQSDLVSYMHDAYDRIGNHKNYDFGVFIAGPSKTADIEQSLVLGAHGPKTMTVFLLT